MTSKMKHIATILIALIAVTTQVDNAPAQGDLTNLTQAIERNEELLMQAAELVRQTNSVKARSSLQAAVKLHELSKAQLLNDRPVLAVASATRARQAILNTINIAKREAKLEEQAMKAMERANVRLQQARAAFEEVGDRDDVPARKLIEEAHHQLQRARNNMQEHMFSVALQLANASAALSTRAITMLKRDGISQESVLREIERTDSVIERVTSSDQLEQHEVAARAIEQAMELQNRAKSNVRRDNLRLALEQTLRAREIALRVIKSARGGQGPSEDAVARAIEFTDGLLEHAMEMAREQDAERAHDALEQAVRLQNQAKDEFGKGEYGAAMRMTLRAREIAKRALGAMKKPMDAATVANTLAQTDAVIEQLRSRLEDSDNETAQALYERARDRQANARTALEAGELRRALALTRVARNLARRGLAEIGDGGV